MAIFFKKYRNRFHSAVFFMTSTVLTQFQEPQGTNLPSASATDIIVNIMNWIFSIVGVVAVISFAIAGLLYLTSGGSEGRLSQAKSALVYAIVGLIVALGGLVAIRFAYDLLGASLGGMKY